jgi:hypothetical protein
MSKQITKILSGSSKQRIRVDISKGVFRCTRTTHPLIPQELLNIKKEIVLTWMNMNHGNSYSVFRISSAFLKEA